MNKICWRFQENVVWRRHTGKELMNNFCLIAWLVMQYLRSRIATYLKLVLRFYNAWVNYYEIILLKTVWGRYNFSALHAKQSWMWNSDILTVLRDNCLIIHVNEETLNNKSIKCMNVNFYGGSFYCYGHCYNYFSWTLVLLYILSY